MKTRECIEWLKMLLDPHTTKTTSKIETLAIIEFTIAKIEALSDA